MRACWSCRTPDHSCAELFPLSNSVPGHATHCHATRCRTPGHSCAALFPLSNSAMHLTVSMRSCCPSPTLSQGMQLTVSMRGVDVGGFRVQVVDIVGEGNHSCAEPPPFSNSAAGHASHCLRFRAKRERFYRLPPESQGQNLAMTVLYVPSSLDSGMWGGGCGRLQGAGGDFWGSYQREPGSKEDSNEPVCISGPSIAAASPSRCLSLSLSLSLSRCLSLSLSLSRARALSLSLSLLLSLSLSCSLSLSLSRARSLSLALRASSCLGRAEYPGVQPGGRAQRRPSGQRVERRDGTASERRGDNLKGVKDLHLKAKALTVVLCVPSSRGLLSGSEAGLYLRLIDFCITQL